jgi:hypothetical protein
VRLKAISWDAVVLTFNRLKQTHPMTFGRQDRLKLQLDYAKYLTSTSIFAELECEVRSGNKFICLGTFQSDAKREWHSTSD